MDQGTMMNRHRVTGNEGQYTHRVPETSDGGKTTKAF